MRRSLIVGFVVRSLFFEYLLEDVDSFFKSIRSCHIKVFVGCMDSANFTWITITTFFYTFSQHKFFLGV